nr:hypothetical protein [Burkholderia gladioli]
MRRCRPPSTDAVAGRQLYATNQAIGTHRGGRLDPLDRHGTGGIVAVHRVVRQWREPGSAAVRARRRHCRPGAASGRARQRRYPGRCGMAGSAVNFAGTAGARQLKGVAAGTDATDGVNLQQLQSVAAAVGAVGAGAVSYDDAARTRVTLGTPGAGVPVTLTNVADANLTSSSTDAVSGRQLFATNQTVSALAGPARGRHRRPRSAKRRRDHGRRRHGRHHARC